MASSDSRAVGSSTSRMATDGRTPGLDALLRRGAARLHHSESPMLDARILMRIATGFDDALLISRGCEPINDGARARFDALIARRARGEPISQITGHKEFCGLNFRVTADVLSPRPDSEALIEEALREVPLDAPLRVLDLGVGSGCLLAAVLSRRPNAFGAGVDRSPAAARLAGENLAALGLAKRGCVIVGDWAGALDGIFDLVVANPPYISEGEAGRLAPDVAAFEPREALFAGADGFSAYSAILPDLSRLLASDGLAVFEAGNGPQCDRLAEAIDSALPDATVSIFSDLAGRPRGVRADRQTSKSRCLPPRRIGV